LALTALDILVLLTVGLGAAFGFSRGFVSESVSLAAWILAILAVKALHTPVSAMLVAPVGTESGAAVLGFALIFGLTFLAVKMAGKALGNTTKGSILGPFDRVLGLAFGALKGLIAATLVFLFVSLIYDTIHGGSAPRPGWMTESRTYPLLRASSASVVDFIEKRRAK
jgi:membrane protein required for colicin V production